MSKPRYAHCQFCDDIRQEVGNKTSLMGIYGGEMFVTEFPFMMIKFCIAAYFETPADKPLSELVCKFFLDETLLQEQSVPTDTLKEAQNTILIRSKPEDPIQTLMLGFNGQFASFLIEKPSVVKVVMIADGEEYVAGKLRIDIVH